MKLLFQLPDDWQCGLQTQTELADTAVERLMTYLGALRRTQYCVLDHPDRVTRNRPAADFRYVEPSTSRVVAIEFKRWTNSDSEEIQSIIKRNGRARPKGNVKPMELGTEQIGLLEVSSIDDRYLEILRSFVVEVVQRQQLQQTEANERILLIYDSRMTPSRALERAGLDVTTEDREGIDQAFIIADQRKVFRIW